MNAKMAKHALEVEGKGLHSHHMTHDSTYRDYIQKYNNLHAVPREINMLGVNPRNRPYSHKGITANNYVNCPSIIVFACLICLFHPPIFEKILMRIRSIIV